MAVSNLSKIYLYIICSRYLNKIAYNHTVVCYIHVIFLYMPTFVTLFRLPFEVIWSLLFAYKYVVKSI